MTDARFAELVATQQQINHLSRELLSLRSALCRRQPTEQDRRTVSTLEIKLTKLYHRKRALLATINARSLLPDPEALWSVEERAIWTLARRVTPNSHGKGQPACSCH
ncbi:hypothetical protein [Thermorudis peleae]|uniref:hypothetical protein n=1 Tax=Thermorudis peleae TaxID=1382356 RepID=UPI00057153B3|nr:hypothetical protein [Thermorudis peleae]